MSLKKQMRLRDFALLRGMGRSGSPRGHKEVTGRKAMEMMATRHPKTRPRKHQKK